MTSNTPTRLGTWRAWHEEGEGLRVGVSGCLLGQEVRYDGGHKRDRFLTDVLSRWATFVPVCPEFELGMGVPRPTIRLQAESGGDQVRLVCPSTGADWTRRMERFARRRVRDLEPERLDGFVLKKDSPSCGMERVPVSRPSGNRLHRRGVGLFAAALLSAAPGLPVEEEGRLNDDSLREGFLERLFCRNRWRTFLSRRPTRRDLVEFHTAHKLLLRAHDETGYRRLGRLVGQIGRRNDGELFRRYEKEFQACLARKATPRKHANVLHHALGHLKRQLAPREKQLLLAAIDDFRSGFLPLIVPVTLMRSHIVRHEVEYLAGQLYFDPHPGELMLRNHC